MAINTRKVRGRRRLRFADLDAVLSDVRQVSAAPHYTLGNWSLAQIVKHPGHVMHGSIDGSATPFRFPWPARIVGRLILRPYLLHIAVPREIRLPRAATRQFMFDEAQFDEAQFDEAYEKLATGVARLKCESQRVPHPLIGKLSPAEWNLFHLRHCELHLGFVVPRKTGQV